MSDYTKTTNFTAKDSLSTGDPDKLIKGSLFDTEFDNIATAVLSKYDSTNLATQSEAELETSNTTIMTPLRVANWADYNAGMVGDIQALTDPNADVLLGWDDSAGAAIGFTLHASILHSATELSVDHDAATNFVADEHVAHSGVSVIAANAGLAASNNNLASNIGLSIDVSSMGTDFGTTAGVDLDVDYLIIDDGGTDKKVLASQLVTPQPGTAETGTTATLDEADFGKAVLMGNAANITVTLPNGLKEGFWTTLINSNATGSLIVSATTTLRTKDSLTTCTKQWGAVTCYHSGSNIWYAWGDLDS